MPLLLLPSYDRDSKLNLSLTEHYSSPDVLAFKKKDSVEALNNIINSLEKQASSIHNQPADSNSSFVTPYSKRNSSKVTYV